MPCNRCGTEFGLFKKENYCRNCGFAFCGSCLSKKIIVPKLGTDSKHSVCHKCYGALSSVRPEVNANNVRSASPPSALQRRMDAIPRTNKLHGSSVEANGSGRNLLTDADKDIAERLANLRATGNPTDKDIAEKLAYLRATGYSAGPVPSLPQLEERLARLKGLPVVSTATSNAHQHVLNQQSEMRTNDEQIQDLLQQFSHRVELDSRFPKPEEEIRMRLAQLRGDGASLNDLNKPPANLEPPAQPSMVIPAPRTPPSCNGSEDEMMQVWQYMLETEKEALREAEEALTLQEKDVELKKKLEEIKANRDTPKRRRGGPLPVGGDLSDEDNEDKIADKVIQQFLSESMIDNGGAAIPCPPQPSKHKMQRRHKEEKLLNFPQTYEPEDVDELPWCVICNEDASLRCYGCEGDLYCRRCFRECHAAQDVRNHIMGPFNSKTDLNHRTPSYIEPN